MRRIISLLLWSVLVCSIYAQDKTSIIIGQRSDGSDISVQAFHFKKDIKNYTVSPDFRHLGLEFVNNSIFSDGNDSGQLGIFDTTTGQLCWIIQTDYRQAREVLTTKGVITTNGSRKSYYDDATGDKRWTNICSMGTIVHNAADSSDVLFGYQSLGSGIFAAVDIASGDTLWTAKIYHNKSYAGCKALGNGKYLIMGDKMYLVDSHKGVIATYEIHAGIENSGLDSNRDNKGGLIAGMVGNDIYSIPMLTNSNIVTGLNSNICIKDSCIYFADCERLVCLDYNLVPRWTHSFPKGITAHSMLNVDGDNIYMLNMGNGLRNNKVYAGIPYIASFNRLTGAPRSFKMLADKKSIIEDAVVYANRYFLLSMKGVASRTVTDTTSINYTWNTKKYGMPYSFLSDTLYAYNPSTGNFAIMCHDDYNCPVLSTDSYMYMVDKDLFVNSKYPIASLYKVLTQDSLYVVISNGDYDSWIIRKSGVPVMHFSKLIVNCDTNRGKIVILTSENDVCITDIDILTNKR